MADSDFALTVATPERLIESCTALIDKVLR